MGGAMVCVEVGQVWRHKYDRGRKVTITDIFDRPVFSRGEQIGVDSVVTVVRNTSRRRQAIKVDTLYRQYRRQP